MALGMASKPLGLAPRPLKLATRLTFGMGLRVTLELTPKTP